MQTITTIGLDIAKSVFQVHGIDAGGRVIVRRQLKRGSVLAFFQKLPPCLVGIEACASSHHWSRELQALGHTVRLMPPAYVKPYVKRQKNDATDNERYRSRNCYRTLPGTGTRFSAGISKRHDRRTGSPMDSPRRNCRWKTILFARSMCLLRHWICAISALKASMRLKADISQRGVRHLKDRHRVSGRE